MMSSVINTLAVLGMLLAIIFVMVDSDRSDDSMRKRIDALESRAFSAEREVYWLKSRLSTIERAPYWKK